MRAFSAGSLRGLLEPLQEGGRLRVVPAFDRVVDEVLGRFLVVAVLEDLSPCLARRVPVAELIGVEIGGLTAERGALGGVSGVLGALQEQLDEIVPAKGRRVSIRELLGVFLVRRFEVRSLDQVDEGARLVAAAGEVVGAPREVPRLALRIGFELGSLNGGLPGPVPALRRDEASLGGLPQLASACPVARRIRVCVSRPRRVVELFVQLAEPLEESARVRPDR